MKKIAFFALFVLVLSQTYIIAQAEASITTNSDNYQQGDIIEISGSVDVSSDPYQAFDVTLKITAPNGNLISIEQTTPNDDGSYSKSIQSGESWKHEGDYTVIASYGFYSASTNFAFSIPEAGAIDEVVEAAEEAVEAAEAVAGEVVGAAEVAAEEAVKAAGGLACGAGTYEADGFCIPDGSDSFGLSYDSASANGLILTAAIAFGIAVAIIIVLRLIGKAGRSR